MSCEQTEKLATAYSAGELPPENAARFEKHMLTCGDCTGEVASTAVLDRSLRGMRTHFQPSAEFTAKVLLPLQKKTSAARAHWYSNLLPAIPALAVLLLVLVSAFWWRQTQSRQLVAELSDIHAATLASANPVDVVSTDRHVVKPWFEGKLPFAFNVPELGNTGFKLDGARLIYLRQQPGAELVLHYGLHRCSIFIFEDSPSFAYALTRVQGGAFHLEMQRRNGLILFAVGDLDQAPLHNLGNYFAAAQ